MNVASATFSVGELDLLLTQDRYIPFVENFEVVVKAIVHYQDGHQEWGMVWSLAPLNICGGRN